MLLAKHTFTFFSDKTHTYAQTPVLREEKGLEAFIFAAKVKDRANKLSKEGGPQEAGPVVCAWL